MGGKSAIVIAIDGPAASGKSTVAIELARHLELKLVDSGSMYRAVTLRAVESGIAYDDEETLTRLAREVCGSFSMALTGGSPPRIHLGERDVTAAIRSPEVGEAVSSVSAVPGVREEMLRLQRTVVRPPGAVVEGRDIGTTVFPEAPLKVYLEASPAERTRRRYEELVDKGIPVTESEVEHEIEMRDAIDSSREHSPLAVAPDAVRLDTTELTVQQVVDEIVSFVNDRDLLDPGPGLDS